MRSTFWQHRLATGMAMLATLALCAAPGAAQDRLPTNGTLTRGAQLVSNNGKYVAIYQSDGNFVVYGDGRALWHSQTTGRPGDRLVMQGDGNLVIYQGHTPVWHTQTGGRGAGFLVMQDDANLVIYRNDGVPVWASRDGILPAPAPPPSGPLANVIMIGSHLQGWFGSRLCLDVRAEGGHNDGTELQIWGCVNRPDKANQQFVYNPVTREIRVYGSKCVAAGGGARAHDPVVLWSCNGHANQKWEMTPLGQIRGINGLCFDVRDARAENGARIQLLHCKDHPAQKWNGVPLARVRLEGNGQFSADAIRILQMPGGLTQASPLLQGAALQQGAAFRLFPSVTTGVDLTQASPWMPIAKSIGFSDA